MLERSNYLIRTFERIKLKSAPAYHRIISANSKLVIEGPPRCGNSSALRLVVSNNPTYKKRIATHIHRSFQIYYAMKYKVPAVVMLPSPKFSTVSHASLLCQLGQVNATTPKEQEQLLKLCILEYLVFTMNVFNLSFRQIVPFEEYIRNSSFLIEYLNREFFLGLVGAKQYQSQQISEAVHVFPSYERDLLKNHFVDILETSTEVKQLLQSAQYFYEKLMTQKV